MGRGLAGTLVGVWLGLLVASWLIATVNFRTVDRVLAPQWRPEVAERLSAVSPADRRALLRHVVSEVNRWMFRVWGPLQLALGALALGLSWRAGGAARVCLGAALALLVVQSLWMAAPIVELGRSLDFVPRPLPAEVARRFGRLHAAYVVSDLLKAALLAGVAWFTARRA